jgi:hypothetical protein
MDWKWKELLKTRWKIINKLNQIFVFKTAMGNPNWFEGQNMDFYCRLSRFFYEIGIFQRLQKGHTKEPEGPQVAHGWFKILPLYFPAPD